MAILPGAIPITGFIGPTDDQDVFATHESTWGKGDKHVVDLTARDAITTERRVWGMMCHLEDGTSYQLVKSLVDTDISNNANWKPIAFSSSALTVAAGSTDLLDITANEISVKALLVTSVTESADADLATFIGNSYTVGDEFQEGDVIILSTPSEVYIHNGGTAVTAADFRVIQVPNLTDTYIRNLVSATGPLSYNPTTGVFTIAQANTSTDGYLSQADWNTFNSKLSSVDLGYTASTNTITNTGGADAVLPTFTSTEDGLVPLSGGGTTNFLRADGTWAAAGGSDGNGIYDASNDGGTIPTLFNSVLTNSWTIESPTESQFIHFDGANNRLGINTNNPLAELSVKSKASNTFVSRYDYQGGTHMHRMYNIGGTDLTFDLNKSSGTTVFRIDSRGGANHSYINTGGSVIIGASAPVGTEQISLQGTTRVGGNAQIDGVLNAGNAEIASNSTSGAFGYNGKSTTSSYAIKQVSTGTTILNSESGRDIIIANNNTALHTYIKPDGEWLFNGFESTTDVTASFAKDVNINTAKIGEGQTSQAHFALSSNFNSTDYALKQTTTATVLNCKSGGLINFTENNTVNSYFNSNGWGLGGSIQVGKRLYVNGDTQINGECRATTYNVNGTAGATGTGTTVTVVNGIVTAIS